MKLNLGCGEDHRDGWKNIDIRDDVDPDVVADISDLPYQDNSIDTILAQDVLEHFEEPVPVLKEWRRLLTDDGTLIIRVPDWNVLGDRDYWEGEPIRQIEKDVYGGHKNPFDQHHTLWTKELMFERLRDAGYTTMNIVEMRTRPVHWHLVGVAGNTDNITESIKQATQELQ